MAVRLDDFIRLYKLPPGRAIHALERLLPAARAHDAPEVARLAERALEAANALDALHLRRSRATSTPLYGPEATRLDSAIDRLLSAMAAHVASQGEVHADAGEDDPTARAVRLLARDLFPKGVAAIVSMSFVEEHKRVGTLLKRVEAGGDLADAVDSVGMRAHVVRLRELAQAFGAELDRATPQTGPTADEVRAADAVMQLALNQVVAAALGRFVEEDDATVTARAAVLGPIATQQAALAARYRDRRGVRDVDPQTGLEREALIDVDPSDVD